MKKIISHLVFGISVLTLSLNVAFAGGTGNSYSVNTDKSSLKWTGKKVTGEHFGTVKLKSGSLLTEGNKFKGGKFDIDLTTLVVEDLKDAEYNGKLLGHLKSDDFFSVEKHPVANLDITSVKAISGEKYDITGKLTIKGITQEITFPATIKVSDKNVVAVAKISVDRTKYDIKYGSASFFEGLGDKAIDNNFILDVAITATK